MAIVAGTAAVQRWPALPALGAWLLSWLLAALACSAVLLLRRGRGWARRVAASWLGLSLGIACAIWQAQERLADTLAARHHDAVSRLVVRVADLPQGDGSQWRFLADTMPDRPAGIPARLAVSWRALPGTGAGLPDLVPGQLWQMALVLRRPHGLRNPDGYDAEGRLFALGIRATATVRGTPRLLDGQAGFDAGIWIQRIRHRVRAGMRRALGERRYAPVLIALAMGDQAGVAREDWRIFNRSGITHLVSISGMHVTLIAGLGAMLAAALWRRARWRGASLAEYLPAQVVGAAAALGVALLYCLLAGWGVPARRTFFMLAVVALAAMARLPLSPSRVLALAAAAVVLLDPWATLAPGFWLSFGAVAILLRAAAPAAASLAAPGWLARLRGLLAEFTRVQAAITLGLVPLLAQLLNQVSLGSPLANAIAIPVVSFVVTPLALLCAALGALPGFDWPARAAGWLGHAVFDWTMLPVGWIGASRWAVLDVATAPWPLLALAALGVAWALQPPGWPARAAGWLLVLPLLCWRPERPAPGFWRLAALDVGQGGAVLVETATQAWLFDTGPGHREAADAGERVVAPYLRTRGHRRLDGLVVSHADLDHSGGLASVLAALPVDVSYASFDLPALLRKQAGNAAQARLPRSVRRCAAGTAWQADGVQFKFLHPPAEATAGPARGNAASCVLLIQGQAHAALLPGDIGAAQERRLAPDLPRIDVVMAPHHGSATSSSAALVAATGPRHVIAQAGHLNRFRHPSALVEARWRQAGTAFWRTDRDGAVVAASSVAGLQVRAQRAARRYWHAVQP
ncbi:DNA internalization-related competence protein ComEC/Rec2 [Bordetella petrii]|uniref:DNA internalization-related competence protein ComEC/Rec2 n=1 Tax=Bordetella petrii TaxID=94624 RepID=UPI0038B24D59